MTVSADGIASVQQYSGATITVVEANTGTGLVYLVTPSHKSLSCQPDGSVTTASYSTREQWRIVEQLQPDGTFMFTFINQATGTQLMATYLNADPWTVSLSCALGSGRSSVVQWTATLMVQGPLLNMFQMPTIMDVTSYPIAYTNGGDDTIRTNVGNDIIIGGVGSDTIMVASIASLSLEHQNNVPYQPHDHYGSNIGVRDPHQVYHMVPFVQ